MRLRNVKDKSEMINSEYIIKDPTIYKGRWKELFNDNPIHIEIGMGKGKFIIDMALKYPNINFIGIEKYDSVIIRAVQKLKDTDIPNLKLIRMDAYLIEDVFDHEIDRIYLNFSDPWPKDKHAKRRLTSDIFLKRYDNIFKGDKDIIVKTDNKDLFLYSLESFKQYGYELKEVNYNLNDEDNVNTEYEEKFRSLDKPIYRIKAFKCKQ